MKVQFAAHVAMTTLAWLAATAQASVEQAPDVPVTSAAQAQAEQEDYYAGLDQQIAARDGRRRWAPPVELGQAAQAAWPGARVGVSACGAAVCRVHLSYSGPILLSERVNAFVRRLSDVQDGAGKPQSTGGIALRYHPERPSDITVYLLAPQAPLAGAHQLPSN